MKGIVFAASLLVLLFTVSLSVESVFAVSQMSTTTVKNQIYVLDKATYSVTVIRGNKIKTAIGVGYIPEAIVYDPIGKTIYVGTLGGGPPTKTIWVINTTTNKIVTSLSLPLGGPQPYGLAYDNANHYLYVSQRDAIGIINTIGNVYVKEIGLNYNGVAGIAFDPSNNELYAPSSTGSTTSIEIINTTSNAYALSIPDVNCNSPNGVAYDPINQDVYVACAGSPSEVLVLSSSNGVITTIPVGNGGLTSLAYSSKSKEMYVSDSSSNNVYVISSKKNIVVATISVGSNPQGIAYNPKNYGIYVANEGSSYVSIINSTMNKVVKRINLVSSSEPIAISVS